MIGALSSAPKTHGVQSAGQPARTLNAGKIAYDNAGELSFTNVTVPKIANSTRALMQQIHDKWVGTDVALQIPKKIKNLRLQIRKSNINLNDFSQLRRIFRNYSKGAVDVDLMLLGAIVAMERHESFTDDTRYYDEIVADFVRQHESALQASVHIHEVAKQYATMELDEMHLKALYEHAVVNTQSILQALRAWIGTQDLDVAKQHKQFLQNAMVADLFHIDTGADKAHLTLLLAELKTLRLFTMIEESLHNLSKKRLKKMPDGMFATAFDYVEQPIGVFPHIEKWVQHAIMDEQILFFQDMRNFYQRIPDEAYTHPEQKASCRNLLQQRIDDLVYSE